MSRLSARAGRATLAAVGVLVLGAAPAFAQALGQGADDGISPWRVFGALLLCSLLAFGGALALRARGGALPSFSFPLAKPRRLKLVESLRLSQTASLSIVECDGRELLVATSPEGSRVLEELPPAGHAAVQAERA
ncbi:MAG TPA: flagellar biosynthetic protein FliO [Rhizomicrobium sp.]|nr:flagellar biosynthetic protein FliO [Rhizomicrobium sp.]